MPKPNTKTKVMKRPIGKGLVIAFKRLKKNVGRNQSKYYNGS